MARQVNAWRVHFNILKHKEYVMKKYASKQGSQLVKTANGYKFKISQDEWKRIGKEAGWLKAAEMEDIWPFDPSEIITLDDYLELSEEQKRQVEEYRNSQPPVEHKMGKNPLPDPNFPEDTTEQDRDAFESEKIDNIRKEF